MADISKIKVDGADYDIKDAVARESIAGLQGITYVESTDTDNMTVIRDMESGTYVFYGKFKAYTGSTSTITFSSRLLVNVVRQTAASHVMVFYPVNNCVQYLKITDTDTEKKYVYLNDLMSAIGTLDELITTEKASLVAAINEVAAGVPGGEVSQIDFSNFENGSFTETVDGETINHSVTFDEQGRPSSIDGVQIVWGSA